MKQEQLIAYSLILFIVIPILITSLGGILILGGVSVFFPYAKFLYSLTVSLALLLFIRKNFHMRFAWTYVLFISLLHTFSLRHSYMFRDINLALDFVLIITFFVGIMLCIHYIFLNKNLRSIRTLLFSLMGAVVFTIVFALLLHLAGREIYDYKTFLSDFSMGFMLFATIGIGFLLTDIVLNAIANHYHLKPDFMTTLPPESEDSDAQNGDKDEDD
jgi:hypothetical protein